MNMSSQEIARSHQMLSSRGEIPMTERQHMPTDTERAASWSDAEAEEYSSAIEVPRRSFSDYYVEQNADDIILSDENGGYNYDMQEVHNYGEHGVADAHNDEGSESVHDSGCYVDDYYYNDEKDGEQYVDNSDYPFNNYDEGGYQSCNGEGGSQSDADNWEENGEGYYTDENSYHPFDLGSLGQLPYPPSLDFGDDDSCYEADNDGECHFDDLSEDEQQNEYEARELQQLSAESLDVVHRIEVLMERIVVTLDRMEAPQIVGYKASSISDEDDSSCEDARDIIASNLNENGDQNFCRSWDHIGHCRTFTSICLVMSFIHQLLLSMRTTTTREVYYVFVTHFRSQRECDSAILDVAKVLGVSRRSLGLSASPKGWFCGCVEITRRGTLPSGKDISGTIDGTALSSIQGLPITREWIERDEEGRNEQGVEISVSSKDAKCILVVEKEGVYNRLSEERLYDRFPCIIVTGKGFPDLCTRALVKTLHEDLDLPVLGLCDMNPYGISVLSVYFCAGNRMGVDGNYRYSVPIEWMGLRPTEVKELHDKHRFPNSVFQALTVLDRKRIDTLTDEMNPYLDEEEKDEVSEEMKYKVELEALYWLGAEFLGDWVFGKLQARFE